MHLSPHALEVMAANACANAAMARHIGDEAAAEYWWDEADRCTEQAWIARRMEDWDELKGSPDHG